MEKCVANPRENASLKADESKEKYSVYEKTNFDENSRFGRGPRFARRLRDRTGGATIRTGNAAAARIGSHSTANEYDLCVDARLLGLAGRPVGVGARLLGVTSASGRSMGTGPLDTARTSLHLGAPALAVTVEGWSFLRLDPDAKRSRVQNQFV